MIKTVIRIGKSTQYDTVIVFDESGEQIPKYQGRYEDVKESILRDAPATSIFAHGLDDRGSPIEISRENW